jgi:hypothetical protein
MDMNMQLGIGHAESNVMSMLHVHVHAACLVHAACRFVWLSWLNFSELSLSRHCVLSKFRRNFDKINLCFVISFRRNFVSGGRSHCEDFYSEQLRHISFRVASFEQLPFVHTLRKNVNISPSQNVTKISMYTKKVGQCDCLNVSGQILRRIGYLASF